MKTMEEGKARKARVFFLTVSFLLLPLNFSFAGAGTSAADFLRITPDSQSAALGNSGVANAGSGFLLHNNPSLLSQNDSILRLAGGQTEWLLGTKAAHYSVSFTLPSRSGRRWGVGLLYSDWGTDPFEATDPFGNITGEAGYGAQNLGVGLARQVTSRLSVGASMKKISQSFDEKQGGGASSQVSSGAAAWDVGAAYETPFNITVGAVAQNLGNQVKFEKEGESLPRTFRLGAQGTFLRGQFTWSAEGSQDSEKDLSYQGGLAYRPFGLLSLRLGYDSVFSNLEYLGLTSGVGFHFKSFNVDYALVPFGEVGMTHRVSLSWQIGKWGSSSRAGKASSPNPYDRWMDR